MRKKNIKKESPGADVQDASHLEELKSSCGSARLAFISASHDARAAASDDYVKAKAALENALKDKGKESPSAL